ncbi:ribosome small subunit-dependent GTPase A [Pelagicoccus albus]|uniref:Small ribosomal subunit biogenesis GTPase RsgA n=1 Tax=Pelagicoccus albus TaxID=415222 RepID=A0A7X1E7W6_9BACT|nr:ribosome small subunit-dependent GTPase A [Pelagicoccus albus]MBC2605568.1 ribosome small subunit-dependent GTPase A [Pelagicoccus albus]
MSLSLEELGWSEEFERHFAAVNDTTVVPARVIRENRGEYIIHTGKERAVARLPGVERIGKSDSSEYPTVGDWLAVEKVPLSDDYLIRELLPRKSLFERKVVGEATRHQSIVANFDSLFLVTGLDADFNTSRIQRYLSVAWNSRAQLVVILNKADLIEELDEVLAAVKEVAKDVPVHAVSAFDPASLECLKQYLGTGRTVALLGSSGVGKSSLTNAFIGEDRLLTQQNRAADGKGRHTTTWRELSPLPGGGMLIDLPGMRELQLTGEGDGVDKTFSDIEELMTQCKFRNCRHEGEPGCAIDKAIESGDLAVSRYKQYVKLRNEQIVAQERREARDKIIAGRRRKIAVKEGPVKKKIAKKRKQLNTSRSYLENLDD